MSVIKKIKTVLSGNVTTYYDIHDIRIPEIDNSTAGQIIKVNSARTTFELADESVTTITLRRWEDSNP